MVHEPKDEKFKQRLMMEEIAIPATIIKIRPYLYGNKKTIYDPECQIKVKADIWITDGLPNGKALIKKSIRTKYIPRADVDVDNKTVIDSKGTPIVASNIEEVFNMLGEIISSTKNAQK